MTNKILKTTEYTMFKFIKGNRPINYTHVGNLVNSIKEKDLAMPIIVDQDMNVVDGQHRLKAYEILSKPVTYIVKKDLLGCKANIIVIKLKIINNIENLLSFSFKKK